MDQEAIKQANETQTPAKEFTMAKEDEEREIYVARRVKEMQDFRTNLKIEDKWKEADSEYIPSEITFGKKKRFESDDETGWRSRLVPVIDGDEDWRSKNSDPMLLAKIQTAISIIFDNNPEAVLTPLNSNNESKTGLQYALWKRNWNVSSSKEVYKMFVFDMAKYGTGFGRSYPRKISYDKDVLIEVNEEDPSKNIYEKRTNVWFNDIAKSRLNPYRTWIDEQSKPYDDYSMNDCYFEIDFSYDQAKVEFGKYKNFEKLVPASQNLKMVYENEGTDLQQQEEFKKRQDIITIGFYENRLKDLFVIRIPKLKKILYSCPLPNDDGMLSVWFAPWIIRSADNPYGISLWEIIKQKKALYDKMLNMTMDQLVLSIMKMFFYTGTNNLVGDGKIKIRPGRGVQIVNGKIDFLEVPGPGKDAFEGLKYLKSGIDDDSGLTPAVEGEITGKTLGEILHAKEASLKRLKTPVENIAWAMEQDAYLTCSWMAQAYSTPEVKSFVSLDEIKNYEMETGMGHDTVVASAVSPEGEAQGPFAATFLPQLNLQLEKNGSNLIESRTERFFQVGKDIEPKDLKWRGIFKVVQKSIIAPSAELEKQRKMEVFNICIPLFGQPPELFAKSVKQVLKVNEENYRDWLPDTWIQYLENNKQSLFVQQPMMQQPMMQQPAGAMPGMGQGVPSNQTSMQGTAQTTPGAKAPTVVPQQQLSVPQSPGYSSNQRSELTRSAV